VVELLARDVCGVLHLAGPERIDRLALARAVLMERGIAADALVTGIRATLGLERLRPRDVSLDAARARALLSTPLLAPQAALESVRAMGRDVP
jgi:dTDP-4-dehydrorhamnose reductase